MSIKSVLINGVKPGSTLIKGWVKTVRLQKNIAFVEINDGSSLKNLQAVVNSDVAEKISTGTSVEIEGTLKESPGNKQNIELQASNVKIVGESAPDYPLQKKRHTLEFLREIGHLRVRSNTISSMLRVRDTASFATHSFFRENGFLQIHTPILTTNDCEGAGELFRVNSNSNLEDPKKPEYFGKPTFLTVSGQLHAEIAAGGIGRVFTFGPTFRAENSNTRRHLAEFWMIEAEQSFINSADDLTKLTESYVKYVANKVLKECPDEIDFFNKFVKQNPINIERLIKEPFQQISYTDAIITMQKKEKQGKVKFQMRPDWGKSLQLEHEKFIAENLFEGSPVFITNYSKNVKPFYMLLNEDKKTVANFDLILPHIAEIVGGSLREHNYSALESRLTEAGLNKEEYQWYLDLRKYGSAPHGGFGVGFERLIIALTGLENIRDVIPFPRTSGSCAY